jgi:hypothetical protein
VEWQGGKWNGEGGGEVNNDDKGAVTLKRYKRVFAVL